MSESPKVFKTLPHLPFRHPEAQLLADLTIARECVHHAHTLIQPLCSETFGNLTRDETEMRWTTAIIRYTRAFPFGGGVLHWDANALLAQLDDQDRSTHMHTYDVRSGYLAHSVGGYEDVKPFASAVGTGSTWQVISIGTHTRRILGPSSRDADDFARLTTNVETLLGDRIRQEQDRLVDIAQSLGEDYFAKALNEPEPSLTKPKKPRQRFRAK